MRKYPQGTSTFQSYAITFKNSKKSKLPSYYGRDFHWLLNFAGMGSKPSFNYFKWPKTVYIYKSLSHTSLLYKFFWMLWSLFTFTLFVRSACLQLPSSQKKLCCIIYLPSPPPHFFSVVDGGILCEVNGKVNNRTWLSHYSLYCIFDLYFIACYRVW